MVGGGEAERAGDGNEEEGGEGEGKLSMMCWNVSRLVQRWAAG